MHEITGNLWEEIKNPIYSAVCCTTNMTVKKNGELVMGAGVAKQFAKRFPSLPKRWGYQTNLILKGKLKSNLIVTKYPIERISTIDLVSFPTKYDWKEKSDIDLIKRSAIQVYMISQVLGWFNVLLPRPGCSNGGLDWHSEVKPILLEILDERFWIITLP
jgi:hypothetical protein